MDPPFLDTWWEFLGRLRHVPTMNFKHPEIQNGTNKKREYRCKKSAPRKR